MYVKSFCKVKDFKNVKMLLIAYLKFDVVA